MGLQAHCHLVDIVPVLACHWHRLAAHTQAPRPRWASNVFGSASRLARRKYQAVCKFIQVDVDDGLVEEMIGPFSSLLPP